MPTTFAQFNPVTPGLPVAAAAIHSGHLLRPEAAARIALDSRARLREEDPHTDCLARQFTNSVVAQYSRFEVDLNRPPKKAVYVRPEDAWGLQVWRHWPSLSFVDAGMQRYHRFYQDLEHWLEKLTETTPALLLLDLHSYNHRREGPTGPTADPAANPEINIGTGSMPARWRGAADRFIGALATAEIQGRCWDVRENVKFKGGHFPQWVNSHFGDEICVLSIEFKKIFMDEWTGQVDADAVNEMGAALVAAAQATIPLLVGETV